MMDLRSNPRAVAAARRIQAQTGFDVLDDAAVEQVAALCVARRVRARRSGWERSRPSRQPATRS
jgi:hypothetical protein